MSISHGSIANTLARIYFGDAIWFSRIADPDFPVPPHDALPSLDIVIEEWPRLQAKWEAWANSATDLDLARQVPFKSRFVGNAGLPAWQIVVHVVNHATLHRGQIVGVLRQLGVKPPRRTSCFAITIKPRLLPGSEIRRTPQISAFWAAADNEKDSIGSAPAEGWCGATESSGRSASDRIH